MRLPYHPHPSKPGFVPPPHHSDEQVRRHMERLASLLTPILKAFLTD